MSDFDIIDPGRDEGAAPSRLQVPSRRAALYSGCLGQPAAPVHGWEAEP